MRRSTERPRSGGPGARSQHGSPGSGRAAGKVLRFDRVERAAHWLTALLVLTLVATGLILYIPALSLAVGRRLLIEDIHVYAGVCVFVPIVVAAAGPWGRRLRADLSSMNRFTKDETAWLRSLGKRGWASLGKFNPGQKLNTYTIGALLSVLLVTGLILRWGNFLAVHWRTGATFVHDWFALALVVVVAGHILFALTHPGALRSMITGKVRASWLERHAPAWRPSADVVPPVAGGVDGGSDLDEQGDSGASDAHLHRDPVPTGSAGARPSA